MRYRKPKCSVRSGVKIKLSFDRELKNRRGRRCVRRFLCFIFDGFHGTKMQIVQASVTIFVVAVVCFGFRVSGYRFGSEVVVDGVVVGIVTDQSEAYKAIERVAADLKNYISQDVEYNKTPTFVSRIVGVGGTSSVDTMRDNLLAGIDHVVEACGIYIDDKFVVALPDHNLANETLELCKKEYAVDSNIESIDFDGEVEIKKQVLPIRAIKEVKEALTAIKGDGSQAPLLNVKVTRFVQYSNAVPYDVETVKDGDLYKGKTKVVVEGSEGEESVNARVVCVNGKEIAKDILSVTRVREPQKQVEKIGAKDIPRTVATGVFSRPACGSVSSRFGLRWGRKHEGIDIAGAHGSDIKAADGGVVVFVGSCGGYGNLVRISHENGYETYYGHCSSFVVKCGDKVAKGDVIAKMGSTGNSTGPHLHFEVRKDGVPQNPQNYVNF